MLRFTPHRDRVLSSESAASDAELRTTGEPDSRSAAIGSVDRSGLPDVIQIAVPRRSRWYRDELGEPEIAKLLAELLGPVVGVFNHETDRARLVRALTDLGQDPIDLDFMSDDELRSLHAELSAPAAVG